MSGLPSLDAPPPLETAPPFTPEQLGVLRRARTVFGAAIAACLLMPVGVVVALGREALRSRPTDTQVSASRAALAVAVAGALVAFTLRMQTYKANWQGDVVTPRGYGKAMRRYAAAAVSGLAGASAISLAVGHPADVLYPPAIALALLVFGFPDGKPMLPQPPDFGRKK